MNDTYPPDRRVQPYVELEEAKQQAYEDVKKAFGEHRAVVENRLRRFFIRALVVGAILGVANAISLAGFSIILGDQADISDEIQEQRFDALKRTCDEQNERNRNTLRRAKEVFPERTQLVIKVLVDELQPYVKDCKARAELRVKGLR